MPKNALDIEQRIDRQEPATTRSREVRLIDDLIALHRADIEEVDKKIGRSKDILIALQPAHNTFSSFLQPRLGLQLTTFSGRQGKRSS